jgi:hypothetical protein
MPGKLDELRRRAEQTARDLDEKYKITSKLDQGTQAAADVLRKGVDAATSGIDAAREEISRIDRDHKVSERVTDSARKVGETIDEAARNSGAKEKVAEVASDVKAGASDIYGEARRFYENASGAARSSASGPPAVIGTQRAFKGAYMGKGESRQSGDRIARVRCRNESRLRVLGSRCDPARRGRCWQLAIPLGDRAVRIKKTLREIRSVLEAPGRAAARWEVA